MLEFGTRTSFDFNRWFQTTVWSDGAWLLREYWKRILCLTVLGAIAGFGYTRWHPEEYVSRATVRFLPQQVGQNYVTSNVAMQVEQRIFAVTQMVNSRLTATQMIETFGLYPQKRRFYPIADLLPEFQQALQLRPNLETDNAKAIPSIVISFRYAEPEKAQLVVQRIVEMIYEETRRYRSDQSIGTTDFLQQELKTVTANMGELEQSLAALPTPGGEDKEYRNILRVEHLNDLERRLTDLQHNMNYVRTDLNLRKTLVGTLQGQLKMRSDLGDRKPISPSSATVGMRGAVADAAARYEQLRRLYQPTHPEVISAEQVLNDNRKKLQDQERLDREVDYTQDLRAITPQLEQATGELAAYQETLDKELMEEASLTTEIDGLRKQFATNPQKEDERLRVMREYDVAKTQYADLTRRQRESQLASDMERRGHGETAELVEPPTFPLRAEYPRNWMILASSVVSGMLLGFGLAVLTFLTGPTVRIARHLDMLTAYPVIASLPAGSPLRKRLGSVLTHSTMLVVLIGVLFTGCGVSGKGQAVAEFQRGEKALKASDYKAADIYFRRALQIDHLYGEAYLQLSDVYLALGHPEQAYEQMVRAGELLPDRPEVNERLAEFTYQMYFADPGRPAALLREVEKRAEKLMQTWPKRPTGYRLAGQVLLERHRGDEAIQLMERALQSQEDGPLRVQLASAYFQAGERAKSEENLRTAIRTNPKYTPGFDLLYLQLMDAGEAAAARALLAEKVRIVGGVDAGLQLAAHDEASGAGAAVDKALETLADTFKNDPVTFAKIGDFWLHRNQFAKAQRWYEAGAAAHPDQTGLFVGRRAELLMASKDMDAAKALVDRELAAHPEEPLLRAYHAAMNLEGQGVEDRRRTQAELESVLAQMPNSPFVRLHLGRAYLLNGDVLRAGEQLRSAVNLDPNYAPGWLALAELQLNMGESGLAQEGLTALLRRVPGYAPARLLQAQASLAQNKPGEAEAALEALRHADPENMDVLIALARAKVSLGRVSEGAALLQQAAQLHPSDPTPILIHARLELATGDSKAALARLRAAESKLGDVPEISSLLGSVALLARDNKTALAEFERLLTKSPENLEYRLGYANSLALIGQADKAKQQYEIVQQKAGNDPQPWLLYASLMSSAGNHVAAKTAYQEAIRRDANNPYALNNLAFLLAREGKDLKQALTLVEQARRVLPRSREIQDTLAYIYLRLDMTRNATATLEQLASEGSTAQQQRNRSLIERINRGDINAVRAEMEKGADDLSVGRGGV